MCRKVPQWCVLKAGRPIQGSILQEEQLIGDLGELIAAYELRRWFILLRYIKITPTGSRQDAYPVLIPVHTGANRLLKDRLKRLTEQQKEYLCKLRPLWDFIGFPYSFKIGESSPHLIEVKTSIRRRFKETRRDVSREKELGFHVLNVIVDLSSLPAYRLTIKEL